MEKVRLLVVEDRPEYLRWAKLVFDALPKHKPEEQLSFYKTKVELESVTYASTYEEALASLETGNITHVITDMFFPSETDWRQHFTNVMHDSSRYALCDHREEAEKFSELPENPSGIAVTLECWKRGIPSIVISQGNRHVGVSGTLRFALENMDFFYEGNIQERIWVLNFESNLKRIEIDKTDISWWLMAWEHVVTGELHFR